MENKIHVPIQKPVIKCDKPTNMSLGGPQFNHPSSDGTIWSVKRPILQEAPAPLWALVPHGSPEKITSLGISMGFSYNISLKPIH